MARPATGQPTDAELEILKILWELGPSELGPICGALRERREVATTTVATVLGVMRTKKLVKRTCGPKGYLWSPRATREMTQRGMVTKIVDRVFDGSAHHLVAHLLKDQQLSEDDLAEIRRLLDEPRRRKDNAGGK